jgi:rubrerythrin
MNTDMLLEQFRKILDHELRARRFYDHYIGELEDEDLKAQLTTIRDDEIKHIKIAETLIGYVS